MSRAWTALLDVAYSVNAGSAVQLTKDALDSSIDAFTLFDGALQFQHNHLQSSVEKERIYDTLDAAADAFT